MRASPLRHFPLYETRDPETTRETLGRFGISDYQVVGDVSEYLKRVNSVTLKDLSFYYGVCSTGVRMKSAPVGVTRHQICFTGSGRTLANGVTSDMDSRKWSGIIPAGEVGHFDFGPGYAELRMAVDDDVIKRKLGALIGDAPVANVMFARREDTQSPGLARFRRLLSFLLSELDAGGPQPPGLVVHEIAEALLVSYLYGQSHNFSDRLLRPDHAPSSLQQRLAEDYIAARWNEQLSIEDIAAATNVSARSIFRSFKETHGCSPFQYVKRLRLERARAMLLGEDQQSVISVALKCGFQSLGHFASGYRSVYGELPSQTSRR